MGCFGWGERWERTVDDMRDLMAPYLLDALEPDERSLFETYLEDHPELLDELETMRTAIAGLGDAAAVPPPDTLRASVLDEIAQTPQESTTTSSSRTEEVTAPWWRRWSVAAGLTAAAVVVAIVVAVSGAAPITPDDVLAAQDGRVVVANVGAARSVLLYSEELGRAVVMFDQLAAVGPDEIYELWVIDDDGPRPSGLFNPEPGETTVLLTADVPPDATVGLTIEPAGGSSQPTGEILAVWDLSA